ncbi:antirestriction protein [Rouxiella badensis]|jgi:hypothetical protein|uniref:antirestriction protein n=1 Tax=Rouxiella badensis TaxID=1646377 RepID=UPI0017879B67|nr:antirestriction protein [Rouxiella badensis]QOI57930.1 antirestriction protein [Rouxiella badensis subsp. acadiensis]
MHTDKSTSSNTARIVSGNRRLAFLPRLFGANYRKAESFIFSTARSVCREYAEGVWIFKELPDGGGYLVPPHLDRCTLRIDGNGFEGEMSADAAGIVLTLLVLNRLSWDAYHHGLALMNNHLVAQQDRLKDYADQHPESGLIFRAID